MISTIIPVYNGEAFLGEAIESVRSQTIEVAELVVVDDGSSDGSADIASELGATVVSVPHRGVSAARNAGLAVATGDYVAFLDADDKWEPDKLDVQMAYLSNYPEADGVLGHMRCYLAEGTTAPTWLKPEHLNGPVPAHSLGTLLTLRSVFERVGPFDESLPTGEDGDWFFRARDLGVRFDMMPNLVLHRRIHEHNLSHRKVDVRRDLLESVRRSLARKREHESNG